MGSTMMVATDGDSCPDSSLMMMIGENLATCSPAERELVAKELFPHVVLETYSSPSVETRGMENTFLDMLQSLSNALIEFRAIRNVERTVLGQEYHKSAGPLVSSYLKVRAQRASGASSMG